MTSNIPERYFVALVWIVLVPIWFVGMFVSATIIGWRRLASATEPLSKTGSQSWRLAVVRSARYPRLGLACFVDVAENGVRLRSPLPFFSPIDLPFSALLIERRAKGGVEVGLRDRSAQVFFGGRTAIRIVEAMVASKEAAVETSVEKTGRV